MSSFSARDTDSGVTDDSVFTPIMSPFDERIPSKTGTPTVEFTKLASGQEIDKSVEPPHVPNAGGDENSCPNLETADEKKLSTSEVDQIEIPKRTSFTITEPEKSTQIPRIVTETEAAGDSPAVCNFDDVSMMSVDGNMSVDFGCENTNNGEGENCDSIETAKNSTFEQLGNEEINSSKSKVKEKRASESDISSCIKTPISSTGRHSSVCDDDLFLTPTQGNAEESGQETPTPTSDTLSPGTSNQLNRTFDKPEAENSQVETKSNGTFDKEPSVIQDESILPPCCKSPDFELRLDSTCQPEEDANHENSNLAAKSSGDVPKTPTRRSCSSNEAENEEHHTEDDEVDLREKRNSSFLKRRCSILELSFVSSPKRGNFQAITPRAVDKSACKNLINFNESIAFDFSAAAKSAEINGGVAEMGSFVFSASSGLPVVNSAEIFDSNIIEEANKSLAPKDEKFTRVSFIAMFDPIKVQEENQEKSKTPIKLDRKSTLLASHRSSNSSPLIKGLPTPIFAKPNPVKALLKSVEVQTDPIPEPKQEPEISSSQIQEVEAELIKLNDVVESQAKALSAYEEVVKVFSEVRRQQLERPQGDSKLQLRLAEELARNKQLEDSVKSVENSMYSTLMRMQESRAVNEDLRKVVEEQQTTLVELRTELDRCQAQWQEDIAVRDDEKQKRETQLEETNRAHEKAVSMYKLQLQAKDSEIESLSSQNTISRKELDSLRSLVNSMKLQ